MTLLLAAAEPSSGERVVYGILAVIIVLLAIGLVWNSKGRGE